METTHVREYDYDGTGYEPEDDEDYEFPEEAEIQTIEKDEVDGIIYVYITAPYLTDGNSIDYELVKVPLDLTTVSLKAETKLSFTKTEEDELLTKTEIIKTSETPIELGLTQNEIIITTTKDDEISKGKIYANYNKETPIYQTEYEEEYTINISLKEQIDKITINNEGEYLVNNEDHPITTIDDTKYIRTKISKTNFEKILGTEGYIYIYNENDEIIETINKSLETDENGDYIVEYKTEIGQIKIETSKPIADGFLNIKNEKVFKENLTFAKVQMQNFKKLRTISEITTEGITNYTQEITTDRELKETISKATLTIGEENLNSVAKNENVELKIELNNSNINSDLWNEAVFVVEFPEEVEEIEIKSYKPIYEDELALKNVKQIEYNGNKAIEFELEGVQKEFIAESIINGTTVLINVDIKINELTTSKENNEIKLYYHNQNVNEYEDPTTITLEGLEYYVGQTKTTVNYVAPKGVQSVQKISEFDENGSTVMSANQGEKTGKISILEPSQTAKMSLNIINNTGNQITDIKALGRIPFKGVKDLETNEDLGTTVDILLKSLIEHEEKEGKQITVYYSEKTEATTDLEQETNGWKENIEDISKIKSYLITIDKMETGEKLEFNYKFEIPENLEHGEYIYGAFGTYYTNNTEEGAIQEKEIADKVGLTTGIGARLSVEMDVSVGDKNAVNEEQRIKYSIKLENTGSLIANNVIVSNIIPDGTTFIQEETSQTPTAKVTKYKYYENANRLEWNLGNIEEGKTVELEFEVEVNRIPTIIEYYGNKEGFTKEEGKYYLLVKDEETGETTKEEITDVPTIVIQNKTTVKCDNIEKEITSNVVENTVKKAYLKINETSNVDKATYLSEGQTSKYTVTVENNTDIYIQNITLTKIIPEGMNYEKATIKDAEGTVNFDESTNKVTVVIKHLEANERKDVIFELVADTLKEDEYKKEITTNTKVQVGDKWEGNSNNVVNYIGKPKLTTSITCDVTNRYIKEGDFLTYTISVKNESDVPVTGFTIIDYLPEGVTFASGTYKKGDISSDLVYDGTGTISIKTNLKQEEMTINIKVQADELQKGEEEKTVINKVSIKANNIEEKVIGQVKHTIEPLPKEDTGDEDIGDGEINQDGNINYKIKGTAWLDENKNGQREYTEKPMQDVTVYLLDENGILVKDEKTGAEKTQLTDENGEYTFKELSKGKYLVVFVYNNEEYSISEYQKPGVLLDENSDAILTTINFNGKQQEGAVTDILEIEDNSIYSIDIGLVIKPKFDLKIENTISKITVKNNTGTTVTEYGNTGFAKKEIHSKHINNSIVLIEYSLKITNTGDVEGTASKILNSKANGLTFSSNLNENWYEGNDGNLYSTYFANQKIKPGETKEIKLILTKNMTEKSTVNIENKSQIVETYNDKGLKDKDNSNDQSTSNCLITIATGEGVVYTTLILVILVMLLTGIYSIKQFVIGRKK